MLVKLKSKDPRYPDLSEEQHYFVLGIEAGDYRIEILSRVVDEAPVNAAHPRLVLLSSLPFLFLFR
jgi:hypothetical protein